MNVLQFPSDFDDPVRKNLAFLLISELEKKQKRAGKLNQMVNKTAPYTHTGMRGPRLKSLRNENDLKLEQIKKIISRVEDAILDADGQNYQMYLLDEDKSFLIAAIKKKLIKLDSKNSAMWTDVQELLNDMFCRSWAKKAGVENAGDMALAVEGAMKPVFKKKQQRYDDLVLLLKAVVMAKPRQF